MSKCASVHCPSGFESDLFMTSGLKTLRQRCEDPHHDGCPHLLYTVYTYKAKRDEKKTNKQKIPNNRAFRALCTLDSVPVRSLILSETFTIITDK